MSSSSHGTFKFIIFNVFYVVSLIFNPSAPKKKEKTNQKSFGPKQKIRREKNQFIRNYVKILWKEKKSFIQIYPQNLPMMKERKKVQPRICICTISNYYTCNKLSLFWFCHWRRWNQDLRPLQVLVSLFSIFFGSFVDCLNTLLFTFCSCVWMSECWMHYAPAKYIMKHPNHLLAAFYRSVFFFTSFHFVSST